MCFAPRRMCVMADRPILFSPTERRVAAAAVRLKLSSVELAEGLNRGEKFCGRCRSWKIRSDEHFAPDTGGFGGLRSHCRECVKRQKRSHYDRTRPEQRARQLRYQRENRDRLYAYNASWQRKRHMQLRCEAISAYGSKCACCGETEKTFLDLDHINNDGSQHRRELGNSTQIMLQLKNEGWPKNRIQLLCCNCNQGKVRNGGVCPHMEMRNGR